NRPRAAGHSRWPADAHPGRSKGRAKGRRSNLGQSSGRVWGGPSQHGAYQCSTLQPRAAVMKTPILELSDVHKHYANGDTTVRALDGVSLTVHRGEFVAIMGQSGSGKSTLMNIIGCLDRPTSGSYLVLDKEAAHLSPDELAALRRETFGFVFQRYNLLATATAGENVEIPSVYAGLSKQKRVERAGGLLHRSGRGRPTRHAPRRIFRGPAQGGGVCARLGKQPAGDSRRRTHWRSRQQKR